MERRNILITGASSGLGSGMAREFATRGRSLALCARRSERLDELREELLRENPHIRVHTRQLDVTDHDAVFESFRELRERMGGLDRVVVNAGIGKGQPVGTGHLRANLQTAQTNFIAGLVQCEAAMEIFREQNAGHLAVISSVGAMRGLPGNVTAYAASKSGLATLAEGIRADVFDTPISVSTIYPGYIRTELSEGAGEAPFMVGLESGSRSLTDAIENEPDEACVPAWPWGVLKYAMRAMPLRLVAKLS